MQHGPELATHYDKLPASYNELEKQQKELDINLQIKTVVEESLIGSTGQ